MKKLNEVSKRLNISKGKIKDGINKGEIPFEMENGVYYVDEEEVKGWLLSKIGNPNFKPLPKIIKRIIGEAYKDFIHSSIQRNELENSVEDIIKNIYNGKNTLHIVEASEILEYTLNNSYNFLNIENIDYDELKNNTIQYYEKLHCKYFSQMVFKKTPNNIRKSIWCEHFILTHYIKSNYSIIGLGDDFDFLFEDERVS
jgi:excisionase family DNA binding protein